MRGFGATVFDFMGATLTMLHKVPARPDDIDNPVRLAWGVPVPEFAGEFEARFGLQLVELYGSTDVGVPIYHPVDEPRRAGSCGRAIASYDVQLFDESGVPVPVGTHGRDRGPTQRAVADVAGVLRDARRDRLPPLATCGSTPAIWLARTSTATSTSRSARRIDPPSGENISAFEVEEVVKLHPHVIDAAAFGVPSELTEDDVMVAVVPRTGAVVDPAELIEFCRERMARHMLPRYVDVLPELPRTPTEKVEKRSLIERGVSASTWDRERMP